MFLRHSIEIFVRDGRSFEILNRKVSFFPDRRHFTMEGGQKQPDPVAGSSSAKDAPSKQVESSTNDEDVPI